MSCGLYRRLAKPTSRLGQRQREAKGLVTLIFNDPKLPENILATGKLWGLFFERSNVIDFWLVELASVVTDKTLDKTYVAWICNDSDNAWYIYFHTFALMLILKYSMMVMGMLQGDIFELTVAIIICSVLKFNITDSIDGMLKSTLVYCKS